MPKQVGLIKIEGKLGDISFYKSKFGYILRSKGGVSGARLKTDPKFKRARENMAEFGHSAQKGAQFRGMLAPLIQRIKDSRVNHRLLVKIREVMNTDTSHVPGKRKLADGNLGLLEGFEFNVHSPLSSSFYGAFLPEIDRTSGKVGIEIPDFDPKEILVDAKPATHFRFVAGILEWDPADDKGHFVFQQSAYLPTSAALQAPISLGGHVQANSTKPVFFVVGLEFGQEINGQIYVLGDHAYKSARLIRVSR